MTIPPKVRVFRLRRSESVLSAQRDSAGGSTAKAPPLMALPTGTAPGQPPAAPRQRLDLAGDLASERETSAEAEAAEAAETPPPRRGAIRMAFQDEDAAQPAAAPAVQRAPNPPAPAGNEATPAPQSADKAPGPLPGGRDNLFVPQAEDDGFGSLKLAGGAAEAPPPPPSDDLAAAILAVRAEGLTSRQLRTAARLAQQQGIETASHEEAVVHLRRRGIDPFHRGSLSDLIGEEARRSRAVAENRAADPGRSTPEAPGDEAAQPEAGTTLARIPVQQVPAKVAQTGVAAPRANAPVPAAPPVLTEGDRAREILKIQRDIARRRRRRAFWLVMRLAAFVLLPTILAGYYFAALATPLYETKSDFVIQKADGSLASSPLGGMLAGAGISGNTDSVTVKSYLTSREAMMRLESDVGFSKYYVGDGVDFITRLPENPTREQMYALYQRNVKISFDPSEGIVRMAVTATDPELSARQSMALIGYAEGQVDHLTARLRDDQMAGAQQSYEDAEAKVRAAQERVLDLQQQRGVLDPVAEGGLVMTRIGTLEGELQKKNLELSTLLANAQPNQARVDGVRADISRLEASLEKERALLTARSNANDSLAAITGELRIAEADLLTRQEMLAAAAAQVEAARTQANKQVRYLSLGVKPVPPDQPTYPKAFENTLVAFLLFCGIYLVLSLTISVLREQLSA